MITDRRVLIGVPPMHLVLVLEQPLQPQSLGHLLERAEGCAALMSRDLSSGTLAAEQAARHGLLADADAALCKARRERVHGLSPFGQISLLQPPGFDKRH